MRTREVQKYKEHLDFQCTAPYDVAFEEITYCAMVILKIQIIPECTKKRYRIYFWVNFGWVDTVAAALVSLTSSGPIRPPQYTMGLRAA